MIADRLAWAALVAVLWLTLASFTFLWMAGLLDSPGIHGLCPVQGAPPQAPRRPFE